MTPRLMANAPALSLLCLWQRRRARLSFPVPRLLLTTRLLFRARALVLQVMLFPTGQLQHPESHSPMAVDPQVLMAMPSLRLRLSTFGGWESPLQAWQGEGDPA